MEEKIFEVVQVKTQAYGVLIEEVVRRIYYAKGWRWCYYKGRRYQVFGGWRTPQGISLNNPLKKRQE